MDTLTALSGSPTKPMGAYPGPTKLLIDGKWVDAASGKTFETRNPATGELLAAWPRAMPGTSTAPSPRRRALRRAVEPPEAQRRRQMLLLKFADLVEEHGGAGAARHARHGRTDQPYAQQPPARTGHAALLRRHGDSVHGETIGSSCRAISSHTLKGPVSVVGAIIPWNSRSPPRSGRSARRSPRDAPWC